MVGSLFILAFFCTLAYLSRGGKRVWQVLSVAALSFFVIVNRGNQDYEAYALAFNDASIFDAGEIGYNTLVSILKFFGASDYTSVLLVLGVFLFITIWRWRVFVDNLSVVCALFFAFPFVYFIIQIRSSFMLLFLLNALFELARNRRIRAAIFCILAASFHILGIFLSLYFFAVYFFVRYRKSNDGSLLIFDESFLTKYLILVSCAVLFAFFALPIITTVANLLTPFIPKMSRVFYYLQPELDFNSLLAWGAINVVDVIVLYSLFFKRYDLSITNDWCVIYLFHLLIFACLFFFLLGMIDEVNRIFRVLFLVKYFLLGCLIRRVDERTSASLFLYFLVVSIAYLAVVSIRGVDMFAILCTNVFSLP